MALEYNIYLCDRIGDGLSPQTAFSPLLRSYLNTAVGESYHSMDYPQRGKHLVVYSAEPARHVVVQAVSGITRIIPVVSVTKAQLITNLDTALDVLFSVAVLIDLRNELEANGINTAWASGSTTMRELLRYMLRQHTLGQVLHSFPNAKDFLTAGINNTVASVPVSARNQISSWMVSRGLDTTWITGATLVREVLHYIQQNMNHSLLKFCGEYF